MILNLVGGFLLKIDKGYWLYHNIQLSIKDEFNGKSD